MVKEISIRKAFDGVIREKRALRNSENTISEYGCTAKKVCDYFNQDRQLSSIDREDWISFFSFLSMDYRTSLNGAAAINKSTTGLKYEGKKLKDKSILNIKINLSGLYTWAIAAGFAMENPIKTIPVIKPAEKAIIIYSKEDLVRMLRACEDTDRRGQQKQRQTAMRDRAIILMLTATGMRAEELCNLTIADIDLSENRILAGGKGAGTNPKERLVGTGNRAKKALLDYLRPDLTELKPHDRVFRVGQRGDQRPLKIDVLLKLIKRIAKRAGVNDANIHRFRHTFAVEFLLNGGDVVILQMILGHASIETTLRYLRYIRTIYHTLPDDNIVDKMRL